jgi:predicted outer membrane protein
MGCTRLHAIVLLASVSALGIGCASSPPPEPATPSTTTTTAVQSPAQTPTLTSAEIGTTSATSEPSPAPATHEHKARWSDGEILAATAAAYDAHEELARMARDKSKTARVERLAQQMIFDGRELSATQANLARSIPGAPGALESRVADAHHVLSETIRTTTASGFDQKFLDATISYCKQLITVLDTEMIPSAQSPDVQHYLTTLRSKTQSRLLAAEEIQAQLP